MADRQTGVRRVWTATVRRAIGTPRRGGQPIVLPLRLDLVVEIRALPEVWDSRRGPVLVRLLSRHDPTGLLGFETRCATWSAAGIRHSNRRLGAISIFPGKLLALCIPQGKHTGLSTLLIRAKLSAPARRRKRPVSTAKTGATP